MCLSFWNPFVRSFPTDKIPSMKHMGHIIILLPCFRLGWWMVWISAMLWIVLLFELIEYEDPLRQFAMFRRGNKTTPCNGCSRCSFPWYQRVVFHEMDGWETGVWLLVDSDDTDIDCLWINKCWWGNLFVFADGFNESWRWMIIEYRSHKTPWHSSLQAEVTLHHASYQNALVFIVVPAVAMFVVPVLIVILGCCLKHTCHVLRQDWAGASTTKATYIVLLGWHTWITQYGDFVFEILDILFSRSWMIFTLSMLFIFHCTLWKNSHLICCFICRLPRHVIIGDSKYKSWLRNDTQEGRLSFNEIYAATIYTSSVYPKQFDYKHIVCCVGGLESSHLEGLLKIRNL